MKEKPVISGIRIERNMKESIGDSFRSEGVAVEVVTEGQCTVRIVPSEGRVKSAALFGWEDGSSARSRAVAASPGTSTQSMGRLLDLLETKIREWGWDVSESLQSRTGSFTELRIQRVQAEEEDDGQV